MSSAECPQLWTRLLPKPLANLAMLRIVPATGESLEPALKLLFAGDPAELRAQQIANLRDAFEAGDFDPEDLLLAEFDTDLVGVQLTVLRDDDVGMVWPPIVDVELLKRLGGPAFEVIEDELLTAAARNLDTVGAWIGQALLEPNQTREQAALERNGFKRLTQLRFFERPLSDGVFGTNRSDRPLLNYQPYRRSRNRLAFASVLDATYRGSLDCPELNGVRDGRQSLKNHAAAGTFHPDMWRLYRCEGLDAGILLMADRPEQQAWEVLYLGVVESSRGRGIGRAMLVDALEAARGAHIERLLIVADIRNAPALSLYESLGFRPVATRVAMVRLAQRLPHNRPHNAARQQ